MARRPPPSWLLPLGPPRPAHSGRRYNRGWSSAIRHRAEDPATSLLRSPPSSRSARTPGPLRAPRQTSPAHSARDPVVLRNVSKEILLAPLPSVAETQFAPPARLSDMRRTIHDSKTLSL